MGFQPLGATMSLSLKIVSTELVQRSKSSMPRDWRGHGIVESGRQQLGEGPTSDGQRLVQVRRSVPLHNVRRRLDHGHQRKQAPWFHTGASRAIFWNSAWAFDLDLFGKRLCGVPVGQAVFEITIRLVKPGFSTIDACR